MRKPPNTKFIIGAVILAIIFAVLVLLGGCKKDEISCKTCTTTVEYWSHNITYDTDVKSVKKYCSGEADTVQQGTIKTKFFTDGKAEFTKVECK